MSIEVIMRCLHLLAMVVVLGGYIFLSLFLWPALQYVTPDTRLQLRLLGRVLQRFFTVVVLALMVAIITGGLYLLGPAVQAHSAGTATALSAFYRLLLLKLIIVFLVLLLVPVQLFGMTFRLTRMDAGLIPFEADVVRSVCQRLQVLSYLIVLLLTLVVLLSVQL